VMGIRQDFQLAPVHTHINLVGFAAHCVFGLAFKAWPGLKQGAISAAQFWLFVVGSPLFMIGIAVAIKANTTGLVVVGSILVSLGALLFLVMAGRLLFSRSA
jgi:hypothetical protein